METEQKLPSRDAINSSTLSTQAILREIASLKELMLSHVDRIDKAVIVAHEDLVRVPTEVQKAVAGLKELSWEKIECLDTYCKRQFEMSEALRKEQKLDTSAAVASALAAAKDAVAEQHRSSTMAVSKSEAATTSKLDQQSALFHTTVSGLERQINDITERLTRAEGHGAGKRDLWGYIIGAIGLVVSGIAILGYLMKSAPVQ